MIDWRFLQTEEGIVLWTIRCFPNYILGPWGRDYYPLMKGRSLVVPPYTDWINIESLMHNLRHLIVECTDRSEKIGDLVVHEWLGLNMPSSSESWLNKRISIVVPVVESEFEVDRPFLPGAYRAAGREMERAASTLKLSTWASSSRKIPTEGPGIDNVMCCLREYIACGGGDK